MRKSKTRLSYWNNGDFWLRGHAIAETDTCSRFRSDRSTRLNRKRPSSPPRFCYVDDRSSTSEKSHRTEDLLKAMTCGLRRRARDRPSPRRTSAGKSVRQRRDGSLHRWCGRVGGGHLIGYDGAREVGAVRYATLGHHRGGATRCGPSSALPGRQYRHGQRPDPY